MLSLRYAVMQPSERMRVTSPGKCRVTQRFPDLIKLDGSLDGPSEILNGTAVSGGVAMRDDVKTALAVVTYITVQTLIVSFGTVGAITVILWLVCRVI